MKRPDGYTKSGKPYRAETEKPQWIAAQGVNEPMFAGYRRVLITGLPGLFWRLARPVYELYERSRSQRTQHGH